LPPIHGGTGYSVRGSFRFIPRTSMPPATITNFGGNVSFSPRHVYRPRSEAEVLEILKKHRGQRIRAAGSKHSWSDLISSDEVYLTLEHLNAVHVLHEPAGPRAIIGGGCQIKRVLSELDKQGLTLPSVGLISEQTIAGATATGTHGSGKHCLSQYLETVRIAHYDETDAPVITEVTGGDELAAARCSLGCLGIIVSVTVKPRPQYYVEEWLAVYPALSDVLAQEVDWPLQQFYYAPWLDQYLGQHRREVPDQKRSWLAALYRVYWFLAIDIGLHLIIKLIVHIFRSPAGAKFFHRHLALATIPRRWHVVDKSQDQLIMEHELFRHIEMELFVPRENLAVALSFLKEAFVEFDSGQGFSAETRAQIAELGVPTQIELPRDCYTHHYPVCVRRVLPDDTLLSASSGGDEDYYALSLISYARPDERQGFFAFCNFVAPAMSALFAARCHWGKFCPSSGDSIRQQYPRLATFQAVCRKFDPNGRFRIDWLRKVLRMDNTD
jgi:hypothetical protein